MWRIRSEDPEQCKGSVVRIRSRVEDPEHCGGSGAVWRIRSEDPVQCEGSGVFYEDQDPTFQFDAEPDP